MHASIMKIFRFDSRIIFDRILVWLILSDYFFFSGTVLSLHEREERREGKSRTTFLFLDRSGAAE
jgi:hypothetical protein